MNKSGITNKEWLDLAWKFFQQHAQQRISYFNFFVVFSTILISGYVNALNINMPLMGIIIGFVEIFISFIFIKIDERNKFLTKISENIIKKIEEDTEFSENENYSLFLKEEIFTNDLREEQKSKLFFNRQISHGKAYRLIYQMFMVLGILALIYAGFVSIFKNQNSHQKENNNITRRELIEIINQKDSFFSRKIDSLILIIEKDTQKVKLSK